MHTWFECKVSFDKTGEDGLIKRVTEPYLVDALSFTEAEQRISEEMRPFISGDFLVANIKRAKIAELFYNDNGDRWYRCKVNLVTLDESKGVEKRIAQNMMVQASTLKEAVDVLIDRMKTSLVDYEIATVAETALMDVYTYQAPTAKEQI